MSIVTFWGTGKEQSGKTASVAAIATNLAITHNKRILIVTTGYKNDVMDNCFFENKKIKKNLGLFGPNTNIAMEEGISGLSRVMKSNKLSPEIITNYTKIVLKDRLEVLQTYKGGQAEYEQIRKLYPEIINLANNYYDIVFVDLDAELDDTVKDSILNNSNLVVATLNQRIRSLDDFMEMRQQKNILNTTKTLILIGRYDKYSKYNIKNISRYMHERNNVITIPYNTLFFEACEESRVVDLFLKVKMTIKDTDDRNSFFINEIDRATDSIMYRLEILKQSKR